MKGVLFFGAGASHGSSNVLPKSPPTGSGLFNELNKTFPAWKSLLNSLTEKFNEPYGFENGMNYIWENYSELVPDLMQDMARYFVQYELDNSQKDFYSQLIVYLIENGKIDHYILSTINYDLLIEKALDLARREYHYGLESLEIPNKTLLLKLHGSCNFTVKGIKVKKGMVNYRSAATFYGNGITPLGPDQISNYCSSSALYPCMSLYAPGKPNQMARSTIEKIQKNWQKYIKSAEKIIVVGAKPFVSDSHIWDYIAKSKGDLYYIGNKEKFNRWVNEQKIGKPFRQLGERVGQSWGELKEIL